MYLRQDALPKTIFSSVSCRATHHRGSQHRNHPARIHCLWRLALLILAAFAVRLFGSIPCTRFRDLPQTVQNLLQVDFFVAPVL
jgi:hypothetical protein